MIKSTVLGRSKLMQVELIKKIKETKDTFSFIFQPENEISWTAGQFILYRIPHRDADERGIKRYFTIATAPYEKNIMLTSRFDFKNGSSFKKALYELKPGSTVEASDLEGSFVVKDPHKKYVFIAGGIGITPYRSILMDLIHRGLNPDVTILYGNKDPDITFKGLLDKLKGSNLWINIDYIIEPDLINEEVIRRNVKDVYNRIYYISGPFNMVSIMKRILLKMNIDEKDMVIDYFPGYDD